MPPRTPTPRTLDDAAERLGIRVLGRRPVGYARAGRVRRWDDPVLIPVAGDLLVGVLLDVEDPSRGYVKQTHLRRWKTDPRTLLNRAHEAGRRRVRGVGLARLDRGVLHAADADLVAMLLVGSDSARSLGVAERPAMLIPTSGHAFLADSADLGALGVLVDAAEEVLRADPAGLVSADPVVLDTGWQHLDWPVVRAPGRERQEDVTARIGDGLWCRADGILDDLRREREAVLDGWVRLAVALGLGADDAARVREAARSPETFLAEHAEELGTGSGPAATADGPVPVEVLFSALRRAGCAVVVGGDDDPVLVAEDLSGTRALRGIGAIIEPVSEDDHADQLEHAELLGEQVRAAGCGVVMLADGEPDIWFVPYPADLDSEVWAADHVIGDPLLLRPL